MKVKKVTVIGMCLAQIKNEGGKKRPMKSMVEKR